MKKNIETQLTPTIEQSVDPLRAVCAKSPEKYNDLMDIQDISSAFRISKKLVYKLLNEEKINGFLVGRKWLVARGWVIDYLCAQTNAKKKNSAIEINLHIDTFSFICRLICAML